MPTAGAVFLVDVAETADSNLIELSSRDPRACNLTGHVFRSGDGERGSWDRGKVRCRRFADAPLGNPRTRKIAPNRSSRAASRDGRVGWLGSFPGSGDQYRTASKPPSAEVVQEPTQNSHTRSRAGVGRTGVTSPVIRRCAAPPRRCSRIAYPVGWLPNWF